MIRFLLVSFLAKELRHESCRPRLDSIVSESEVPGPQVDDVPVVEGEGVQVRPVHEHLALEVVQLVLRDPGAPPAGRPLHRLPATVQRGHLHLLVPRH